MLIMLLLACVCDRIACVAGVRRGGRGRETSEHGEETRTRTREEREKENEGRGSLPLRFAGSFLFALAPSPSLEMSSAFRYVCGDASYNVLC